MGAETTNFAAYLADYEGHEMDLLLQDNEEDNFDEDYGEEANAWLCQEAFMHRLTGENAYHELITVPADQFVIDERYTVKKFQGILVDTGAARNSTAGKQQYLALKRENPSVDIDESTAGQVSIRFGNGKAVHSIGSVP